MSSWVQGEFKPAQLPLRALTQPPLDASCFHLCSCRDHRRHRGRLPLMSGSLFLAKEQSQTSLLDCEACSKSCGAPEYGFSRGDWGEKKNKTSHTSSSSEAAAVDLRIIGNFHSRRGFCTVASSSSATRGRSSGKRRRRGPD